MRNSTRELFHSTLSGVCEVASVNKDAVNPLIVRLNVVLSMISAGVHDVAQKASDHKRTVGSLLVATSLALMGATVHASEYVTEDNWNKGAQSGQPAARVIGGVAGAVAGALLTQNSGVLVKAAAVGGLAYLGQTIGGIATQNLTDQNGNPVVQTGVDDRGGAVYKSVAIEMPAPGGKGTPNNINRPLYERAIHLSSGTAEFAPDQPRKGVDGRIYDQLEPSMREGLYALMVQAAATRQIASQTWKAMNKAELESKLDPQNKTKILAFNALYESFSKQMGAYAKAWGETYEVLELAQKNGFDVVAQRILMDFMPRDIKDVSSESMESLKWPGVQVRVQHLNVASEGALAKEKVQGKTTNPSTLASLQNSAIQVAIAKNNATGQAPRTK